jgi:hypothetical protein
VRTGEEGVGMDAHDVFPQAKEFAKYFERAGINIHNPENLRWWPSASHKRAARDYNLAWMRFFKNNPNATKGEIIENGNKLMELYGY